MRLDTHDSIADCCAHSLESYSRNTFTSMADTLLRMLSHITRQPELRSPRYACRMLCAQIDVSRSVDSKPTYGSRRSRRAPLGLVFTYCRKSPKQEQRWTSQRPSGTVVCRGWTARIERSGVRRIARLSIRLVSFAQCSICLSQEPDGMVSSSVHRDLLEGMSNLRCVRHSLVISLTPPAPNRYNHGLH